VAASNTLRLVHAKHFAALLTKPFPVFVSHKRAYAVNLDLLQIIKHAHAIIRGIALFQAADQGTREFIAAKAVRKTSFNQFLAMFNRAGSAAL
jgi:hypothetical protein